MNTQTATIQRDEGIKQSRETSGENWHEYACKFLYDYCLYATTVFVDSLWEYGLREPKSPRALGAVMQHAVKEGWIEPIKCGEDYVARPSVRSNMQLKPLWRSRITKLEYQCDLFR